MRSVSLELLDLLLQSECLVVVSEVGLDPCAFGEVHPLSEAHRYLLVACSLAITPLVHLRSYLQLGLTR